VRQVPRVETDALSADAQWLLRVLVESGGNTGDALVPMLERLGLPTGAGALSKWLDAQTTLARPLRAGEGEATIDAMDSSQHPSNTGVSALEAIESSQYLSPEVALALRQLRDHPRVALGALDAMLRSAEGVHPSAADAVRVLAAFAAGDVDSEVRHGVIVLVARIALGVAHVTSGGQVVSTATGEAAERLRAAIVGANPMLRSAARFDLPRLSGLVGATKLLAESQSFHHYHSLLGFIEIDG
jgi:hypothetical protein